jgi:hypothetical protein
MQLGFIELRVPAVVALPAGSYDVAVLRLAALVLGDQVVSSAETEVFWINVCHLVAAPVAFAALIFVC